MNTKGKLASNDGEAGVRFVRFSPAKSFEESTHVSHRNELKDDS